MFFLRFLKSNLEKVKKRGVDYVSLGYGTICPRKNVNAYVEGIKKIHNESVEADKVLNSKKSIIARELRNYECFYTYDLTDCIEALRAYDYKETEIQKVFDDLKQTEDNI